MSPSGTRAFRLYIHSAFHSIVLACSHCTSTRGVVCCVHTWNDHEMGVLFKKVCIPLCTYVSLFSKSFSVSVFTCLSLLFSLFYPFTSLFSLLVLSLLWDWYIYFLRGFWSPALNLKFNNMHHNSFSCPLTYPFFWVSVLKQKNCFHFQYKIYKEFLF